MTTGRETSEATMVPLRPNSGTGDESGVVDERNRAGVSSFLDWTDSGLQESINGHIYHNGYHHRSEIEDRFNKARASALVDTACLFLLSKFPRAQVMSVNDVDAILAGPAGWLKLCLLVNADLVEISGHDLRITRDGIGALSDHQRIVSGPPIDDES